MVYEIDLICDQLQHTKKVLVADWEPSQLPLYSVKPVSRTTLKTPWGKHQNLLRMKLTADITLLFLSAVNNDKFVYCLCYRCVIRNQLNQQIYVILVIGLSVQSKWISKKPSWETLVAYKCLCGEWPAVRK